MNILKKKDNVDRITLFAHSLGSLPTLDFLADLANETDKKIRCVTIGAPASFLATRSNFIRDKMTECVNNSAISEWKDYYSHEDYLCSYSDIENESGTFKSIKLEMESSWVDRMGRKIHVQYFDKSIVMDELVPFSET